MSKNEISRTISCIYFMKIWVDLGFESSEVSLLVMYIHTHFPIIALNICGSLRDEGMNERTGMNK